MADHRPSEVFHVKHSKTKAQTKPQTKNNVKRRPQRIDDLALARDNAGVIVSQRGKDRGPADKNGRPIAIRHGEFEIEGEQGAAHLKRVDPAPLDRYRSREQLAPKNPDENDRLWRAGDRLRIDFAASGLAQRITADLGAIRGCGATVKGERAYAAWENVVRAMTAMGPELNRVVFHVCGLEGSAADWAVLKGWHHSHGLASLKLGLEALARHYGLR